MHESLENLNDFVNSNSDRDCNNLSSITSLAPLSNEEEEDEGKYVATVKINSKEIQLEVDSGCGYTLILEDIYNKLNLGIKLKRPGKSFKSYDYGISKPIGRADTEVTFNNKTEVASFFVVNSDLAPLFGRTWIRKFKVNLNDLEVRKNTQHNISTIHRIRAEDIQSKFPKICEQRVGRIPNITCS